MLPINRYFRWLKSLVNRPGSYYDTLFEAAWNTEFEWSVPRDDNRAADGLRLRDRFEEETSIPLPDLGECRMLEFLVALAMRIDESLYDWDNPNQVSEWFWKLIFNAGLEKFDDDYSDDTYDAIQYAFWVINNRKYNRDGTDGGLFPLRHPKEDQRKVEIWYQMMAYLSENV